MAEKLIRVMSPQTTNGLMNIIDPGTGQMVYNETILPATARPFLEQLNQRLPDNLKHRISDVVPDKQLKKESA